MGSGAQAQIREVTPILAIVPGVAGLEAGAPAPGKIGDFVVFVAPFFQETGGEEKEGPFLLLPGRGHLPPLFPSAQGSSRFISQLVAGEVLRVKGEGLLQSAGPIL
jgi:hypothetical protein